MRTILMLLILTVTFPQEKPKPTHIIEVITINGAINPVVTDYIHDGIIRAVKENAECLIIQLNTPGGLLKSTRIIVSDIFSSNVPIVIYVYPSGAQAASAGVFITLAANIAAMAPGTNIGAAHPVMMSEGGESNRKDTLDIMMEKATSDAAAFIRSIAEKRNRNIEWAEKAVRKSESITAEEALKLNVIDFVAPDIDKLLLAIDQKEVKLAGGKKRISTKNAVLNKKKKGTRQGILAAISDPNISYILLLIGLAGLYFELSTPGAILPGVIGGISLLLAFFGLSTLPVNYTGILLIIFGVILFIAEIKVMSHGMLTVGGIISLIMGSLLLFDTTEPALRISLQVLIPAVAVASIFFIVVIWLAVKAQLRKHFSGVESMIDAEGEAVTEIANEGKVFLKGEYWKVTSEKPIRKGAKVKILKVEGLNLSVEEIKKEK